MQMFQTLWGGEVREQMENEVKKKLRFDKLKVAHTLDMNVNLNYSYKDRVYVLGQVSIGKGRGT